MIRQGLIRELTPALGFEDGWVWVAGGQGAACFSLRSGQDRCGGDCIGAKVQLWEWAWHPHAVDEQPTMTAEEPQTGRGQVRLN